MLETAVGAAAVDDVDLDLEAKVANFEFAPPMTVRKFKTMQDRRVPVSIKCESLTPWCRRCCVVRAAVQSWPSRPACLETINMRPPHRRRMPP